MSNSLSARVKLQGDLHAMTAEFLSGLMEERGRGFASDQEGWAELKVRQEVLADRIKDLQKLHKEMWDSIKDNNGDAFCALANEMDRAAGILAEEAVLTSVMAKIAVEFVED